MADLNSKAIAESSFIKFNMEDVSDHILMEILVRLPDYRSAIQCSSVSKRWFSIISSPLFTHRFIYHHLHGRSNTYPDQPYTLLIQEGIDCRFLPFTVHGPRERTFKPYATKYLNFLPPGDGHLIICSSFNDLLLVWRASDYYICNSVTKRWTLLPQVPPCKAAPFKSRFALSIVEPSICADQLEYYKYRVSIICYSYDYATNNHLITAVVFSSETGEWSEYVVPSPWPPGSPEHIVVPGAHVDSSGIVYWPEGLGGAERGIIAFNPFATDTVKRWRFLDFPPDFTISPHSVQRFVSIGVCQGRARLILYTDSYFGNYSYSWKVWELKDVSTTTSYWSLVHNKLETIEAKPEWVETVCCHPSNGNVIFTFCIYNGCVYRYDILKGKRSEFGMTLVHHRDEDEDENDKMMSIAHYNVTASFRPTFFPLPQLPWPTPLPTFPST